MNISNYLEYLPFLTNLILLFVVIHLILSNNVETFSTETITSSEKSGFQNNFSRVPSGSTHVMLSNEGGDIYPYPIKKLHDDVVNAVQYKIDTATDDIKSMNTNIQTNLTKKLNSIEDYNKALVMSYSEDVFSKMKNLIRYGEDSFLIRNQMNSVNSPDVKDTHFLNPDTKNKLSSGNSNGYYAAYKKS